MRRRPLAWLCLSVLCFCGAWYFWRLGDRWAAEKKTRASQSQPKEVAANKRRGAAGPPLLPTPPDVALNVAQAGTSTNRVPQFTNRLALRLSNTSTPYKDLLHSPTAILLNNAVIETKDKAAVPIPKNLQAQGDPGTYIVQSSGPIGDAFRDALTERGGDDHFLHSQQCLPRSSISGRGAAIAGCRRPGAGGRALRAVLPADGFDVAACRDRAKPRPQTVRSMCSSSLTPARARRRH